MDVELLVIPDCPHASPAAELLRGALDDIGLAAVPVTTTVVHSAEQAERRAFLGSPTITADGVDLFPEPGRAPGLACRRYAHAYDTTTGLPDLRELRQALKQAAARGR